MACTITITIIYNEGIVPPYTENRPGGITTVPHRNDRIGQKRIPYTL